MHCSTTYIPVGVPEHPAIVHKGEGTLCLYGGDADSFPVCGAAWYRLAIHYFTDNPVNVYGTAEGFL